MRRRLALLLLVAMVLPAKATEAQRSPFRVLAFYSPTAELDHVQFAESALKFFSSIAAKDNFTFDSTTDWAALNPENLKKYQVVVWLTDSPTNAEQRQAFQQYMEAGGAWLGFHAAGYNDKDTNWPWYVDFLGGAVFHINSWPPLPAKLVVDNQTSPATAGTPPAFVSPANEWYVWKPSPRLNKDVRVLVTLDPANYPLGLKDVIMSGDLPVVWTNTKYKMIYMNMGHGDKIFTSAMQNKLIEDALLSLVQSSVAVDRSPASGMRISPRAIAVNPKTHKVYAVNSETGMVTVIDDAAQSSATVKVGDEPAAIAINADTNKIYVGNGGSGTVSVIDGATNAVTATVPVGELPYVVAVNPATNQIYISKTFSNTLTVLDGKTNRTNVLKVGVQADAIAVDSLANKIYLTSYEGSTITVIDSANNRFTTVPADFHVWGIAVNPATSKVYLTSTGNSKLTVIDAKTNDAASIETGDIPCAVAVDPAANRIYTANYGADTVSIIDGAGNSVLATVPVGAHPQALAVNPETHTVYVANTRSGTVTVIDGTHNSVVATVKDGNGPYAIAVDATANIVYVANLTGDLTVIDGKMYRSSPATAH
jgi:uncharacterized protein